MKLTEKEMALAKRKLQRMREEQILAYRMSDPDLSASDRELMARYPRHTLAAARLIDNAPLEHGIPGNRDSFYLIRKQETDGITIGGSHT